MPAMLNVLCKFQALPVGESQPNPNITIEIGLPTVYEVKGCNKSIREQAVFDGIKISAEFHTRQVSRSLRRAWRNCRACVSEAHSV